MSPDPAPRPPRTAEALLSLTLPPGGIRESVLGDLHELFVARSDEGPGGARRWYWMQAVRLSTGYAARRLRGARYRGFAPAPRPAEVRKTTRRGDGVTGWIRQARLSFRSLVRSPGFTVPALLILAVGMTASTAIFTVVDSIVFRPLEFRDSHRLVIVCEDHPRMGGACIASPGNAEDFRRGTSTLSELGIGRGWPFALSDEFGREGVRGGLASAGFLRALGVRPVLGRIFTDDEIGPGNDNLALLSHAFWTIRYGGDPSVVGSVVTIDGEPNEIIGVLPEGFEVPLVSRGIELWKPPHIDPLNPEVRGWRGWRAVGRLAEGASVAAASAELAGIYAGIGEQYEEVDDEWRLRVEPLLSVVVGGTRATLLAFLGAAGLLLLIVCANVANLLLARGLGRRQELAVRSALGAGKGRLVKEILAESLVLSALSAALALVLSGAATRLLLALAPPGIPRLDEVSMDGRVLAFTVVAAAAATLLFAVLPALRVTSWDLGQTLKGGARSGESPRTTRLQSTLLLAELALSVVLLSSAALLTRSFARYLEWDPGFDRESLLAVSAFLDVSKYGSRAEYISMYRQAEELAAALPGVVAVATASAGPLFGGGDGATPFVREGDDVTGPLPNARWFDVGPGFFGTLGVEVKRGREFSETDGPDVAPVAIVNESLARRAWPDGDAVGKIIRLPELGQGLTFEVVGVVADVPSMVPGRAADPEIYWSNRQLGRPATFFLVRSSGNPALVTPSVTEALLTADPDMSLGTPLLLTEQAARRLVRPRFQALILVAFALVALVLSAVGVYAVVSYAAARRTREVGIRVALGAGGGDVVSLLARRSLAVAVLGVLVGLGGAVVAGRLIRGLIPGVSPADLVSLGAGAVTLLLVATLATLAPARRATRVDPLEAMRVE